MIRTSLLLVHRYLGLLIAGFLLIAGLSGSLIAFHDELDTWLNQDWMVVDEQLSPTISLKQLVEFTHQEFTGHSIELIKLKRKATDAFMLRVTPNDKSGTNAAASINQIFVHPYTGEVLGARDYGSFDLSRRGIMPFIFKLHYTLHLPNEWGRWLLGGIAIVWLFDSFIGLYLTLPKGSKLINFQLFLKRWSPAWKIKTDAKPARVNYDIHRASGLWLWPILIVTAFTSVYLNLNAEVFKPVAGLFTTFSPMPNETFVKIQPKTPILNFDQALQRGMELRPKSAKSLPLSYISYSQNQNIYRVTFDERAANTWFKVKREQVFFDGDSGELKAIWGYANGTAGDKFSSWQFPLHSGQMFGLPGRILILITGLLTAGLSVTGTVIWFRKKYYKRINKQSIRIQPIRNIKTKPSTFTSIFKRPS